MNDNTLHFYSDFHWNLWKRFKTVNWLINNYFHEHIEENSICYSMWLWLYLKQQYNTSKTSSTAVLPLLYKGEFYPANIWPSYIFFPRRKSQILRARMDLVAHLHWIQNGPLLQGDCIALFYSRNVPAWRWLWKLGKLGNIIQTEDYSALTNQTSLWL